MELRIDLNEPQILQKVTNDEFGLFVSKSWKDLLDPYTPEDTGLLMGKIGLAVDLSVPFQIHYKATQQSGERSYAEYVYFSDGRNFKKPSATDHWDIKAEQAGQKDKLYRTLNNALQSGRF